MTDARCVPWPLGLGVVVWRLVHPGALSEPLGRLENLLADDELARAARIAQVEHRVAYSVTRAALRALLGQLLGLDPKAVPLAAGPKGRPVLGEMPLAAENAPAFNVSHTDGFSLVAAGPPSSVGIDVERHRGDVELSEVLDLVATPAEIEAVMGSEAPSSKAPSSKAPSSKADAERRLRFYDLWTRKEAVAKAAGTGLGDDLRTWSVGVTDSVVAGPPTAPGPWHLQPVPVPVGLTAWLATPATRCCVITDISWKSIAQNRGDHRHFH